MAKVYVPGVLYPANERSPLAHAEKIAYSSSTTGSGAFQEETITKSLKEKVDEVESTASDAKSKAQYVENQLNELRDTIENLPTGGDASETLILIALAPVKSDVESLKTRTSTVEENINGSNGLITKVNKLITSVTQNTDDIAELKNNSGIGEESDPFYLADKENIVFKNDLTNEIETAVDLKFAEGVGRELMDAKTALDNAVEDVKQTEKTLEQQVLQVNDSLMNSLDSVLNSILNASLDIDYNDEGSFLNVVYSLLNLQQQIDVLKDRIQLVSEEDYNSISHTLPDGILYLIPEE